ncbi:hypothetical protein H2200_001046 [Cladophialophora chaetospira]|uniref:Flavin-containing monooxygenase n=1 Tax=Cladophialophora chaetospira TaxID=386627 RepID=A0AA38XK51_9EURO|nr:hypothetical protein H2200_001046 [Cladophialophora chaetospira]
MGSYVEVMHLPESVQTYEYNDLAAPPLLDSKTAKAVAEPVSSDETQEVPQEPKQKSFKDIPFQRTAAFPIEKLPGSLPLTQVDSAIDHALVAKSCVERLNSFDSDILTEDAIWRDIFALTGTLRTFNGARNITSAWSDLVGRHQPKKFAVMPGTSKIVHLGPDHSWVSARFTFETSGTPATRCSGQIGLVPQLDGQWKIWLITSILEELEGFPNPDFMTAAGVSSTKTVHKQGTDYECVVVGAGFAGLCLAGRLQATGIHYLVIERNDNIGDNWTKRYDSARFHTSKYYSDMPLGPVFREGYDYFPTGKELARGYQEYVDRHQLNISLSTSLENATFDEDAEMWTLHINNKGQKSTLKTPHFVFAIGAGGSVPKMPVLPNRDAYKGIVIHSATYKNADEWKGKNGVIVGTGNTAHDVAEDMVAAGMQTTMIQRGRTSVFPIHHYQKWSDPLYNPTVPIEEADRQIMAMPIAITRHASNLGTKKAANGEPERFDALERAGFRVERYGDLWQLLSDRLGGHYMDVGCSKKISDGLIKMKGDAAITGFSETGLEFGDGSKLDADVIVFCTGFSHDVRGEAIKVVGPEIGERLDDYWALDDEGELRGAYKPHGYPGIWYTGGGVTYARFYSRFLALQIKASLEGVPLELYRRKFNSEMIDKPLVMKTAIVTGAASGIGLALTRHLLAKADDPNARERWRVVLADNNEAAYEDIRETLNNDLHMFIRTDVSKFGDQLALFHRAFEWSGGRIDFFANNAGIDDRQPLLSWLGSPELSDPEDPSEPDLRVIDIDLKAVFYGLKCFVHFTRKTKSLLGQKKATTSADDGTPGPDAKLDTVAMDDFQPKMVVTASMAGIYPFYVIPIYTAAKHGCVGFVRAAAPTLLENEGITLNAIMPSTTKTNIIPKAVLDQWPEENFTPVGTVIRAFEELIDSKGHVVRDGLSDGQDGQIKNGCCVEAVTDRLFYRDPVPFPSKVQEWVADQSKRDGTLGRFIEGVMKASQN